ncbi:MAG TPA: glycoside hydrolase family 16 protein [Verrucomicrobiae bacterium]
MKPAFSKFLVVLISCFTLATKAADWSPGSGWTLVWGDEFNGTSLDLNNWTFDLGGGGWGNNELETYTSDPANVSVSGGNLIITAIKNKSRYTSGRIKTQGLHSWTYGKIAARIKLPYGQGIWPAFWMLGDNITTVGWPKCGEIDIMEMIGGGENRDDTIYGTLHWDANNSHASYGSGPIELSDPQFFYQDFHVFEFEWQPLEVIWRLDGVEFFRTSIDTNLWPTMDEFHNPFFIVLNMAVGGNWPGSPNRTTVFPQHMYVDWVRVYQ